MTTTSPAVIERAFTAAKQASSLSKTRAVPLWKRRSCPASFTTHPSGARFPRRIARPPVGFSGVSMRTTTWRPGLPTTPGDTPAAHRRAAGGPPPAPPRRAARPEPRLQQFARDERNAARGVQVDRDEAAAGLDV